MNASLAAAVALAHGVAVRRRRRRARRGAAGAVAHGGGPHRRRRRRARRRLQRQPVVDGGRARGARPRRRRPAGASRCSARCASSASTAAPSTPHVGELVAATAVDVAGRRRSGDGAARRAARAAGVSVTEVPDAATALDDARRIRAPRRRGAGQGQPRGRARARRDRAAGLGPDRRRTGARDRAPRRHRRRVRAVHLRHARCSSGCCARKGIGQQIRDDGPFAHPHEKKAGTPTMGGIAIVVERARSATSSRTSAPSRPSSPRTGITLMALIVGDGGRRLRRRLPRRARGRNLGLRKRGKTGGQLIVAVRLRAARARTT